MSEERFVVVTGVSRGLGRAMARGFAARGHRVAGCARSREPVEELAAELGEPHELAVLDVATGAVDSWAEEIVERHGAPDLVLNSAGLINAPAELWKVPEEEFRRVVEVNLVGTYRVTRAFLPAMLAVGRGVVVNFSSGWGRSTSPGVAPYCATKFAVEGLTRALAQELPDGVAAVALNPGTIDTDMLREAWGAGAASSPTPEAWAERAVPFLLGLGPDENGRSLDAP